MSKPYEFHPHEAAGLVREFTFSDGITTWKSCMAKLNGKQCRFAVGDGRDPAVICKRHTFSDVDVLPELDGVVAPEIEDDLEEPETGEISIDAWRGTATPEEVEEPDDAPDQDEEKQHNDQDEDNPDDEE